MDKMTNLTSRLGIVIGVGILLALLFIAFQLSGNSKEVSQDTVSTQVAIALTEISLNAPPTTPLPAVPSDTPDQSVSIDLAAPANISPSSTPISIHVKEKFALSLPVGGFGFANWSPNSTTLVISTNGIVQVWDTTVGELTMQWQVTPLWIDSFALAPDGKVLATASVPLELWSIPSGRFIARLGDDACCAHGLAWSPDGTKVAGGSLDEVVRIWDVESGANLMVINTKDVPAQLLWSANGNELIVNERDGKITFWDVNTGKLNNTLITEVSGFAFLPNNWIVGNSGDGTITIYSDAGDLMSSFQGHSDYITALELSPDNLLLATGSSDETIKIWDVSSWLLLATLESHTNSIDAVTWSPDSQELASVGEDAVLRIWEIKH